jgi:excisionase family DNA binding protein
MRPDHGDSSPPNHDVEPLWTVKDVADFLRVSRSWVYHRAEAAELPCLRIGALLRFDATRIQAYARGERPTGATIVALRKR